MDLTPSERTARNLTNNSLELSEPLINGSRTINQLNYHRVPLPKNISASGLSYGSIYKWLSCRPCCGNQTHDGGKCAILNATQFQ